MDYDYSNLIIQAETWGEDALQAGWINEQTYQQLNSIDSRTPDSLFSGAASRPLIVAFFGGTGVGKSTLINRLAEKPIAKTGVERPTSREVTLYHHRSVVLQHLPEKLPLEKIKLVAHDDSKRKHVVWMDMPDMDSTEQDNKKLVLEWLPHIDILVYVVSPERYRDNKAWRLLLAEGERHAWFFVINHWDKGQPEQYDDFISQLSKAGFDNPFVIRTISNAEQSSNEQDEFKQLDAIIQRLANEHTIQQLELRGVQVRREDLKQKLDACLSQLGPDAAYEEIMATWSKRWQDTEELLLEGFNWPLQRLAVYYVKHEASLLSGITHKQDSPSDQKKKAKLWDDWAQNRFEDALDDVILKADQAHLPVAPLRLSLLPLRDKAPKIILTQTELAVRQALANPGNGLQRFLLKFTSFCATVLPLAAMAWVGYEVFEEYYESSLTDEVYLGVNFAVHSVLMIAIAWLLPFFIQKQLKPSLEKVALKGLKKGLQAGLSSIDIEVKTALEENRLQRQQFVQRLGDVTAQCDSADSMPAKIENETLSRMLLDQ